MVVKKKPLIIRKIEEPNMTRRIATVTLLHEATHKYAGTWDYCYFDSEGEYPNKPEHGQVKFSTMARRPSRTPTASRGSRTTWGIRRKGSDEPGPPSRAHAGASGEPGGGNPLNAGGTGLQATSATRVEHGPGGVRQESRTLDE